MHSRSHTACRLSLLSTLCALTLVLATGCGIRGTPPNPASTGPGGLLFEREHQLVQLEPESAAERVLFTYPDRGLDGITWAPDRQRFAFASNRDGKWRIYSGSLDVEPRVLVHKDEGFPGPLRWSPDGRRIAYVIDGYTVGTGWVCVVDADSGDVRRVTPPDGFDGSFDWSPDGRSLVLAAEVSQTVHDEGHVLWVEREAELELLDVASGERRRLTALAGEVERPAWSPDGQWIAFQSGANLMLVPATGGDVRTLATGIANHGTPVWAPDSSRLLALKIVERKSGGEGTDCDGVLLVTLDGEERVFPSDAHVWHALWNPAADRILRVDNERLVLLDPESGAEETLVTDTGWVSEVDWR